MTFLHLCARNVFLTPYPRSCDECPCMKPELVKALEALKT